MIKQQQQVFLEENMSNLTSAASGEASVSSGNTNRGEPSNSIYLQQQQQQQQHYFPQQQQQQQSSEDQQPPAKKKRNLPGNPDPDAEVIALSPKSLLATNRFVCEICNKGFQRDQNLQLHRRGHNLPWKLKQRSNKEVKKKVYVCPEPSCVHHDPSRALGDLTGIKKHFCRKHGEKKHKCEKCSKRYAVQSDWKAHSKVCGTREYRCDCGTLFSRRDSFITHRAFCDALAEETARAITTTATNPLLSNPIAAAVAAAAAPSTSHFINLQQQQQQIHQQLMNNNNNNNNQQQQQQDHPLHAFSLKREQQQQHNMINLPPWLACPPMDHHQNQLQSPTSSSSIMFHHNTNQQDQMMHHQQHQQQQQQQQNPNPSNPNMSGPTFSGGLGGAYHSQQAAAASPHMSATALLQKAAQMGATMSNTTATHQQPHLQQHQQSHVTDTNPNTTTPTTSTAGLFGLNLSSRDHQDIMPTSTPTPTTAIATHTSAQFVSPTTNAPPPATTIGGSGSEHHLTGPGPNQGGPSPTPSSYFHDMMVNSLSSTYDHHDDDAFGLPTMGMLNTKKDHSSLAGFHHQPRNDGNGNGGGNDGLTRDFLGLRPLSHSDILTIAGFGNCMTTNTPSHPHHHHHHHDHQQQDNSHKSWQG